MQIIRITYENFVLWRSQIEKLFNSSVLVNFPEADVDESYGKKKSEKVAEFLRDGTAVVFAAVDGKRLTGWVWCHEIHRVDGKRIHIAEIAVDDNLLRQGIGGQLLGEVERYAEINGYQAIDLFVTAGNTNAVAFYERASFEPERFLMKKVIGNNGIIQER